MTQPDPFAPPSGAVPPATPPAVPAESSAPQPRYGAYAPPGTPLPPPPGPAAPGPYGPGPAGWVPAPAAPTGLATAAVTMAVAWTAMQVLLLATSFAAVEPYERALAEGTDALSVWTAYDGLGSVAIPVQVATFVVACLWLQQARAAATALAPGARQVRRPVWVWLGWVVPVVSLWFPFQVVRDVRAAVVGRPPSAAFGWWWACWLVGLWASNQAAFAGTGLGTRDPETIPVFEGIAAVATVAGAILWVGLVREITRGLRSKAAPVA
ncbi:MULTISPECIES: DUF4328 domain-containing protein [unclassified Isoptericola]|uniref:DUF4328 domain-containing protein n=1 Tax=unclassified Isoptericola TaxID=2623355 RepID=UPI003666E834